MSSFIYDSQLRQAADASGQSRLVLTGRVYQAPGTGQPYTVITVDGQQVRVNLVRSNPALPVEIPPESPARCSVAQCFRQAAYEALGVTMGGAFEGAVNVCLEHAQEIVASREFGAISRLH